jgi:hypothetical protein
MEEIWIYLNYEEWNKFPKEIKDLFIKRIFKKYFEGPAPIGSMVGVEKTPCFIKEVPRVRNPYGQTHTTIRKVYPGIMFNFLPHHIIYFYYFGDPGDLQIQHKCGIPGCIQPAHLMLGVNKDNARHASLTRKPDASTQEDLRTWKTWPGDHMIIMHMKQVLGITEKQISLIIKISKQNVYLRIKDILKRETIFIDKKWAKHYTPPEPNELMMWVKLILIRIKKNPELRELFTLKDLQQMFYWTVDFDRTIAWYSITMSKF